VAEQMGPSVEIFTAHGMEEMGLNFKDMLHLFPKRKRSTDEGGRGAGRLERRRPRSH
jgi:hypothetical protein